MKKTYIPWLVCLFTMVTSCKKFDYYQDNPNKPTKATPALLMTYICQNIFNNNPISAAYASRHLTYYERPNESINYNWNRGNYDNYGGLRQVLKLEPLVTDNKNFQGLAHLFRVIYFAQMTETFGDIPYTDALRAELDGRTPIYDKQEDIYDGLLQELEQANSLLDTGNGKIDGDIIYGGDANKWKKLINAYRLRLLIHLSKKEGQTKIAIKQQFQSIISNPVKYPLMGNIGDNAQLVFNTSDPSNYYPTAGHLSVSTLVSLEQSFVEMLQKREDPRLFSFGDAIAGKTAGVFSNYKGVDAGLSPADQQASAAQSSLIARRFVDLRSPVNEPMIFLSYAEQEFLIAEAIQRGWISGDMNDHYQKGITASMAFYKITGTIVSDYLNKGLVKLETGDPLTKILTQKYIAFYMNSSWEPFFEQRRTGVPVLRVGPGTLNGGKIPKRWQYPLSESQYNESNLDAAVKRQFTEGDNVNATMWLIK
ncbi:SusD/RagB family nutrient-binding outer membrane lipoprotein [Sphingobacterium detergens]|uniref:SusD-like starch-binding protein associating with outer membrane n=1 Tax=Sphingobacterium detergens TaxID=1145106 RepID=A0A420AIQ2_SPHD1|nr:SusD/RagB family nutrient-binding outer membrane lipoprotein [Sphingobacterium detergens]RKE44448.1 SusD-like starch-binding protein associating with outer membrane [Sphingobacterium detergens]